MEACVFRLIRRCNRKKNVIGAFWKGRPLRGVKVPTQRREVTVPAGSHIEAAHHFLTLAASGEVREAFSGFVSPDFHHHNPFFPGDRDALMHAMEENAAVNPDKELEIMMTLEDGVFVMTYSLVRQRPGDVGAAVVHIFRFANDYIVELWDIGQEIPPDSPNENGMF